MPQHTLRKNAIFCYSWLKNNTFKKIVDSFCFQTNALPLSLPNMLYKNESETIRPTYRNLEAAEM